MEDQARKLIGEHRYDEALGTVTEVLRRDPDNAFAQDQVAMLEQFVILQRQKQIGAEVLAENELALLDVRESEIPWNKLLIYPEDWRELSFKRRQDMALTALT